MNNIYNKLFTLLVITFLFTQTAYWLENNISNGSLIKYSQNIKWENWDIYKNKTLTNSVEIKVLESPLTTIYKPDFKNTKLIKKLKEHKLYAENYNYLNITENQEIKYPFQINQKYKIKNLQNHPITIKPSYFPLNWDFNYPKQYNNNIYIAEDYGIVNPILKVEWQIINHKRKFTLYKYNQNGLRGETKGKRFAIQNEWNWEITIPAWKIIDVEFSFYTTDINKRNNWSNHSKHYGYYHAWLDYWRLEPFYTPISHSIILPKWFNMQSSHDEKVIHGPFNWEIPINKNQYIEVFKD